VIDVTAPVDPDLEIAEIHRRVVEAEGPALFFHNVKGSAFPVVTNLFGTSDRIDLAFANRPDRLVADLVELLTAEMPPKMGTLWEKRKALFALKNIGLQKRRGGAVLAQQLQSLEELPLLKSWPEDGGHFITWPLVYTEPPEGGPPNLGMYRIQRFGPREAGLHWQIGKGGGFHHYQAEQKDEPLPVSIFIGGPPALLVSAIAPLPENVPELLLASFLQGRKLRVNRRMGPHPLIAECEFALTGHSPPHVRRPEGPFGDHYGYYSLQHPFPLFQLDKIYCRKGAIFPATVVGKPRQEDYYLGNYLQELLSPLFPVVMPGVKDLWSYGETGFHALSAAVVQERFYRECMRSAFRILGEGQLSLTKFLLITDQPADLRDFRALLTTVLERFRPETDLYIFANLSLDTLDYTGPELNKGSRGVLLGVGEKVRDLPETFSGTLPRPLAAVATFSPGCLVLQGPPDLSDFNHLLSHPDFQRWPLLILVDDCIDATKDVQSFLWTVFTRFEPAADIYAGEGEIIKHHLSYRGPILIDARMKERYPAEVTCDPHTARQVDERWREYFPPS